MMSGNNTGDGFAKNRPVLGDVTNRLGKRGLLLISGKSGSKFDSARGKHVDDKEGDSHFTQKVCQGVENIVKEKCGIKCLVNDSDKGKKVCVSPRPCSEINSLRGNVISGISKVPNEIKESNSFDGGLLLGRTDAAIGNVVEVTDASRDSCVTSILMPRVSEPFAAVEGVNNKDEGRVTSEVAQSNPQGEELVGHVYRRDSNDIRADNIAIDKCGSVESSRLTESLGSGSFKLRKCTGLKVNGSSNSSSGVDLIKDCSCSFCLKAAYVLSDLRYQDINGRIAALKKSQKEANIMVQGSCRDKGISDHNQENCNKSSKLESDLVGHWRSLFRHMEDILAREGGQLEASLVTLRAMRESCKAELEMINGMPSEKQ